MNERTRFALIGAACLVLGLAVARLAITGTLTWGYQSGATYQPFQNDQPVGGTLSGGRLISTNNGGLALVFTPLILSSLLCFYRSGTGRPVPKSLWGAVWAAAFLSFPIYAIGFVNLLYDGMHLTIVAHPFVVMLLPLSITAILVARRGKW
jgi:hypothetical protein